MKHAWYLGLQVCVACMPIFHDSTLAIYNFRRRDHVGESEPEMITENTLSIPLNHMSNIAI